MLISYDLIMIGRAAGSAATITISYLLAAAFPGTASLATLTDDTCETASIHFLRALSLL